jgi:hypothetical protein
MSNSQSVTYMYNEEKPLDILLIPDSHAGPGKSLERFKWIGQYLIDEQPDICVDIGDRADMPSLSSFDKGKKSFEGRRYKDDINAARRANKYLTKPLLDLQEKQRLDKKKIYKPDLHITMGNHEERILRVCQNNPELDGFLSYADLQYEKWGWNQHEFLDIIEIQGILFSHYFVSGVMGKAIGGVNAARSHINKTMRSTVSGHSHMFDYAVSPDITGKKIMGLVCGVCVEENEGWNNVQSYQMWNNGICMLRGCVDGTYDLEMISLDRLERMYG